METIKGFSLSDFLGFFSPKWQWPSTIKGWHMNAVTSRQAFLRQLDLFAQETQKNLADVLAKNGSLKTTITAVQENVHL